MNLAINHDTSHNIYIIYRHGGGRPISPHSTLERPLKCVNCLRAPDGRLVWCTTLPPTPRKAFVGLGGVVVERRLRLSLGVRGRHALGWILGAGHWGG
jgi:hypothetical protein